MDSRILLKEYIKELIKEYKSSFNMNYFKTIPREFASDEFEFKKSKIYKYAADNLNLLGEGSSRIAFLMPNTKYVLKIAMNEKGISQNQAEMEIYTNPDLQPIVSKIYDYAPDYSWLISEAVRGFSSDSKGTVEFVKKTGIPMNILRNAQGRIKDKIYQNFNEYFNAQISQTENQIKDLELNVPDDEDSDEKMQRLKIIKDLYEDINYFNSLKQNKYITGLDSLLAAGHYPAGDLLTSQHWGVTANQNIVLLDYGLTGDVIEKHYRFLA